MHVLGEMVFHEVPSGMGALTASMVRHPFTLHNVPAVCYETDKGCLKLI